MIDARGGGSAFTDPPPLVGLSESNPTFPSVPCARHERPGVTLSGYTGWPKLRGTVQNLARLLSPVCVFGHRRPPAMSLTRGLWGWFPQASLVQVIEPRVGIGFANIGRGFSDLADVRERTERFSLARLRSASRKGETAYERPIQQPVVRPRAGIRSPLGQRESYRNSVGEHIRIGTGAFVHGVLARDAGQDIRPQPLAQSQCWA